MIGLRSLDNQLWLVIIFHRNIPRLKITIIGAFVPRRLSITPIAATSFNAQSANNFEVPLNATTITSSSIVNGTVGQQIVITLIQDATGGRTFPWPSTCRFEGGAAPSVTTANTLTTVAFLLVGTSWVEISRAVGVPV